MISAVIPTDLRDYFDCEVWPRNLDGSDKTRYQYHNTLNFFDRFLERPATIDDVEDEHTLLAFIRWRKENGGQYAAQKCRGNLLAIAGHAFRKRHIETMPEVPHVRVTLPAPIALRQEQFDRLYWSSSRMLGQYCGVSAGQWWRAILLFFALTGERTEATLACRWDMLDAQGWLRVPAEIRKGKRKSALYRLPQVVLRALEPLRAAGNDLIFAKPFKIDQFYVYYDKLLGYAGLPQDRRHKPKCLRSTFGSYVALLGGNASTYLGHSNPATFAIHYDDKTLTSADNMAEKVAAALGVG